jgi:hypothetical protein
MCHLNQTLDAEDAPFMAVLLRVLVPAMLWGAGTACGEIPPYAVSRAAALAGEDDEETADAMAEMQGDDAMSKMKAWMAGESCFLSLLVACFFCLFCRNQRISDNFSCPNPYSWILWGYNFR